MPSSSTNVISKDNPVHTVVSGANCEVTIVLDNPGVAAPSLAAGGKQIGLSVVHKNPA